MPTTAEFRECLRTLLRDAEMCGEASFQITAIQLHRTAGRSPRGKYDQMPMVCNAMRAEAKVKEGSKEVNRPPLGKGNRLEIQFPLREPMTSQQAGQSLGVLEGKRRLAEIEMFVRNPKIVRLAKEHYGATCMACKFNFGERYGRLGLDFIECHHIDEISGRGGVETLTRLEDLAMLCANCHRMVHRRKPALTVDQLVEILRDLPR